MNDTELAKPMFSHRIDAELELRLPVEEEAAEGYALVRRNLCHLEKWLAWATDEFSLEDVQNFIRRNLQHFTDHQGFTLRMMFRGQMAGNIGYHNLDWADRKTEIGYWMGEAFQGYGVVTRSCSFLITHAFRELKLNRIEIQCAVENRRSRAIPERLGFKQEGILRQAEWVHDHFNDLVVYSLLASEWPDKP